MTETNLVLEINRTELETPRLVEESLPEEAVLT